MEPVRQCQVRLQIERTQAKAELSQTTCNWQFTTYSSVLTKKHIKHTNQPSKTTTLAAIPYGQRRAQMDMD